MVQAIEIIPEIKPVTRINCGSETDFIDWNSFIWTKDQNLDRSQMLTSTAPVAQASPTPLDQALYQTARTGKSLVYKIEAAPGLYSVHLKFAELWLTELGKRPMDIEINGQSIRKILGPPPQPAGPNQHVRRHQSRKHNPGQQRPDNNPGDSKQAKMTLYCRGLKWSNNLQLTIDN